MLKLEQVSKVYKVGVFGGKDLTAVRDVSFEVRPGEVVSLIGESGSGKTTIGRMVLRLTSISGGAITLDGVDVAAVRRPDLKEYYRKVQGVFQDPFSSYNPIFKADRVFAMVKDQYFPQVGGQEWRRKLDASLEAVRLDPEQVLHKYPHQLSGGQLQRLLIARALRSYYRGVQGVFQDPFSSYNPIFKADRALELVRQTYFPRLGGQPWREKVEASLDAVRLDPGQVLGKYPHQLSGGQLQRLLVARALLLDIRLLVADEIISMLDASTRIDVLNLLGDLKARGLGILFITHDLSLGNYLSDQAVILRQGVVVEEGPTERVFGQPRHPYTRTLLASVPRLDRKWQRNGHPVRQSAGEGG